jgi:hypothetical protein
VTNNKITEPPKRIHFHILIMILANLYPILGVIFIKWDIFTLILLYLIEAVIIGLFSGVEFGAIIYSILFKVKNK